MSNLTNEELVQMFNNAWKTYAECRGNHKSVMNKQLALEYQEELKLRGIEIKQTRGATCQRTFFKPK